MTLKYTFTQLTVHGVRPQRAKTHRRRRTNCAVLGVEDRRAALANLDNEYSRDGQTGQKNETTKIKVALSGRTHVEPSLKILQGSKFSGSAHAEALL